MTTLVVAILGLVLAVGAGFAVFLLVGPFMAGRYTPPSDRRRENRHSERRKLTGEARP